MGKMGRGSGGSMMITLEEKNSVDIHLLNGVIILQYCQYMDILYHKTLTDCVCVCCNQISLSLDFCFVCFILFFHFANHHQTRCLCSLFI